jgi:hypothetical protein
MREESVYQERLQARRPDPSKSNVGRQLRSRRQALKLSLAQIEIDTKIRGKFLTALESGDYSSLPNDVYSRGFVQHYANHGYLVWEFLALAGAPQLAVTNPATDTTITGAVIEVDGHTTPGADVNINDSPILSDTNGNFSEKVALQNGVNTIRIVSQSKLGKTSTVTRNVLATLPAVDPATATVPQATFNGIAVAVKVSDTTSMEVMVDGQEAWRGTVLAGWSKVFTGANDVSLTTGNAGATSVTVTNTAVADKHLSQLGRVGEIRRDQDFAKDTVIP